MATFTKDNAATALELLSDAGALRQQALDALPTAPIHPDEDEVNEQDSPIGHDEDDKFQSSRIRQNLHKDF